MTILMLSHARVALFLDMELWGVLTSGHREQRELKYLSVFQEFHISSIQ